MDRLSLFLMLVVGLSTPCSSAKEADDYPTRDEIVERVSRQIDSIESLQIKWHVVGNEDAAGSGKPSENLWAVQGNSYRDSGTHDQIFRGPYWRSDNGRHNFCTHFGRHAPGVLEVHQKPSKPVEHEREFGLQLIGRSLAGTDESLSLLMKKHPPEFTATEEIEGVPVYRLDFGVIDDVWKCPHTLNVWIDPTAMLPRKLLLMPYPPNGKPHKLDFARGEQVMNNRISEFQRITDSRTGKEQWFPKRQEFPAISIVFDEVLLNTEMPAAFFVPPMPSGTVLYTHDAAGKTESIIP